MKGKMSTDNESTQPGTRCRPDQILANVQVFPHGYCDVEEKFLSFIAALNTPRQGLRRYQNYVEIGTTGEETREQLLNTNIWSLRYQTVAMPTGYYEGATGTTHLWVDYWAWHQTSFLERLNLDPHKPTKESRKAFLEVSCLTWFYGEMGDYETSLVIELHSSKRYVEELGQHFDSPDLPDLRQAADQLAAQISSYLQTVPTSSESVERRQARQERIRQAEQEQADQIARQQAEHLSQQQIRYRAQQRQAELRAQRKAALKVAIIYDTSYLMSNQPPLHDLHPWILCSITSIVAIEVEAEVERNIQFPDRRQNAGKARGFILDLRHENARNPQVGYQNVQLSEFVQNRTYAIPLGPDSITDSLLIEYGLYLLQQKAAVAVVVASRDGGIGHYLLDYRLQTQTPIYYVSDPADVNKVEPLRDFLGLGTTLEANAQIENFWVEFDCSQNGVAGLSVHVQFLISGRKGATCNITALFYFDDGQPLRDINQSYGSSEGIVGVGNNFIPEYDKNRFKKPLFIPYSEFHLESGRHNLKFQITIFDAFSALQCSDHYFFWVQM